MLLVQRKPNEELQSGKEVESDSKPVNRLVQGRDVHTEANAAQGKKR